MLLLCPQVFYLDLSRALDEFTMELQRGEGEHVATVLENLPTWHGENGNIGDSQLTGEEWALLRQPAPPFDPDSPED